MNIKKHIPNALTLLNLLCGCIALLFIWEENFEVAFYLIFLGIFFDFWDGFAARAFGVSGELGLQLDSLADVVTSGVVPGLIMYKLLVNTPLGITYPYIALVGFSITLGAAMRLAKFNIDTRQTDHFIGLPTPANCLFIAGLPLLFAQHSQLLFVQYVASPWSLLLITLLSTWLMNAELPLFSLKFKNKSKLEKNIAFGFLGLSFILLFLFKFSAIPLIIIKYILISIIKNKVIKAA